MTMMIPQRKASLLLLFLSVHNSGGLIVPTQAVKSYAEFLEPETNCKVVLLGVLHGSSSSASDVKMLLNGEQTDVVVLELCASRLADLRRGEAMPKSNGPLSAVQRFVSMVARTKEKKGFPTAIAAFVLGGASGLQTALSGNKPGLEFTTAMELAESTDGCDLILADQSVDETLRKMGSLPSVSFTMIKEFVEKMDWRESYGQEAYNLRTAIFGDGSMNANEQVQLGPFLFRNPEVKNDLVRLTIPPLILAGLTAKVLVVVLDLIFGAEVATEVNVFALSQDVSLSSQDISRILLGELGELVSSVAVLVVGFILLALPAVRVILRERDEYLERGIRAACRLAASKSKSDQGRVVAVLGLLHVNGVAKRLLDKAEKKSPPK